MNQKISYAKTVYGQEEIDAVVKCLNESTQMGKYSREFESKIGQLFNKKHCLYVNSGSFSSGGGGGSGIPPEIPIFHPFVFKNLASLNAPEFSSGLARLSSPFDIFGL